MSIKVASNRLIHSSLEIRAAFYQQLVTFSDFHKLGRWLVVECEKAQAFRQTEKLKEFGLILSGIPIQEYQLIGQFYQAYSRSVENPRKLFEDVIEKSKTYKPKALIALATLEMGAGNFDLGIKFCTEAIQKSHNVSTIIQAARSIAVIKSVEGFNAQALKDLEAIASLVGHGTPIARYQYYNSLAVELAKIGRIEEARNISNIVLASPYVFAYPEWRETGDEIALKAYRSSRSAVFVALTSTQHNIVPLPLGDVQKTYARNPFQSPATVQRIDEWKKMPKKKNGDKKDDDFALPANPTERDIFFRIMHLASQEGLSEKKLWKMLEAVERISDETEE